MEGFGMSIEAMRQAADTLEVGLAYPGMRFYHDNIRAAIAALRAAIEQAEKQEPVAWRHLTQYKEGEVWTYCSIKPMDRDTLQPLYTVPPAAQPAPVQVSPTDFVDMVMDKEDAIGKPIFWAEWPNREKNT
jgi:hypothetical protein